VSLPILGASCVSPGLPSAPSFMRLTSFLQDLLTTGSLTLADRPTSFEEDDLLAADALLQAYHATDAQELPQQAPAFDAPAARWAAHYVYHTTLLLLARELNETVMEIYLPPFSGLITPEAVYAVDLTFRYLPDLLHLAKGLAPGDALVAHLRDTARQWPFSFVGNELADVDVEALVLAHPSLRLAYIDRIVAQQDQGRARQQHLRPLVQAALGAHAATLWPDFHDFISLPHGTSPSY
jgi:hypothetical protein